MFRPLNPVTTILFAVAIAPPRADAVPTGKFGCLNRHIEALVRSEEYEELSRYKQRPHPSMSSAKIVWPKDDVFRFGQQNDAPEIYRAFKERPQADGSLRIPANHTYLGVSIEPKTGKPFRFRYRTGLISEQPKKLRNLLKDVRARSYPHNPDAEREFGAMIFEFKDGSSQTVKLTSREKFGISHNVHLVAEDGVGIKRERKTLVRLVHIHSHPRETIIYPSSEDYSYLQEMAERYQKLGVWAGKPRIDGVMIHNDPNVEDLFIHYQPAEKIYVREADDK